MRSEVRASPEAEHTVWWLLLCRAVEQRVRAALAARAEPSADERRLRRLLCIARHGRSAYTDDGEASDCSGHPSIDYLRDSLDEIEAKWSQRARAALAKPHDAAATRDGGRG